MGYKLYNGEVDLVFDQGKHSYTVDGKKVPSVTQITKIIDKSGPLMSWAANSAVNFMHEYAEAILNEESALTEKYALLDPDIDISREIAFNGVALARNLQDARKAHFNESGKARDIGNIVHDRIEQVCREMVSDWHDDNIGSKGWVVRWPDKSDPDNEEWPANRIPNSHAQNALFGFGQWLIHGRNAWPSLNDGHGETNTELGLVETVQVEGKLYSQEHGYAGTFDLDGYMSCKKAENRLRVLLDWKTGKAIYPEHWLQLIAYKIAREEELGIKYDGIGVLLLNKEPTTTRDYYRFHLETDSDTLKRLEDSFLTAHKLYRSVKNIPTRKLLA